MIYQLQKICRLSVLATVLVGLTSQPWRTKAGQLRRLTSRNDLLAMIGMSRNSWIKSEIDEWAKKGKPLIPWASRPEDLPQAKIPAFPVPKGVACTALAAAGERST